MAEPERIACAYQVVRYIPNILRDEWVNIGVVLFDPASGRVLRRLMEEPGDFARLRRLHPGADENLLRRLPEEFEVQLAGGSGGATDLSLRQPLKQLDRWADTLSNAVQLSPAHGLLAEDLEAELDRLYQVPFHSMIPFDDSIR